MDARGGAIREGGGGAMIVGGRREGEGGVGGGGGGGGESVNRHVVEKLMEKGSDWKRAYQQNREKVALYSKP